MSIHLGVFYYMLGNIRPVFRSSLQAVQLLAVARAEDIHLYGCTALLRPFVDAMKLLSRVCVTIIKLQLHETILIHHLGGGI